MNYETHEMKLVDLLGDGRAVYECPTCGHKVMVVWKKGYPRRNVIVEGDEEAAHAYNIHESEDLAIRARARPQAETPPADEEDDENLSGYDDWIDVLFGPR